MNAKHANLLLLYYISLTNDTLSGAMKIHQRQTLTFAQSLPDAEAHARGQGAVVRCCAAEQDIVGLGLVQERGP